MLTANDLRLVSEFEDIEEEDLKWLASLLDDSVHEDGEAVFEPGDVAETMLIVLEGSLQVQLKNGSSWRVFDTRAAGDITGLLPYSRMKSMSAFGIAIGKTRIASLHKDHFPELLYRIPQLGSKLVGRMSDRVRESTRGMQQRDKMTALGKLSAGLAHELNNPAAAARRAASDLKELLESLPATVARLAGHGLAPDSVLPAAEACTLADAPGRLSALDVADREDELTDWLDERRIQDAWKIAPLLVEAGVTVNRLEQATASIPAEAVGDVVAWIQQSTTASRLVGEIHAASDRISALVASVKSYSHMDRADEKQPVDIPAGIDSTLTMLGHKLREKNITVSLDHVDDLPPVMGWTGELNQVWTNLIDNSVDAMQDGGTLEINLVTRGPSMEICLTDSGSGIPEDVLPRIFEPFYSTKDVGEGTGLGLDIVHRIIVTQHGGDILVTSKPGRTQFKIMLPLS